MAGASGKTGLSHHALLSSQIEEKFSTNQQTQKIYDQKDTWRQEMELIIQELYPSCCLVMCGSSANGFGSIDSDIDLTLMLGIEGRTAVTRDTYTLRRIESLFSRKPRRFETEVVSNAKVPIIILKDKENSFETDITLENSSSLTNAFLLKCYSECDLRVKPLTIVIKLWAKKAQIIGAKFKRLPGFAIVLMVIHFLQAGCSPPVLPVLHKDFPELIKDTSKNEVIHQLTDEIPLQIQTYKSKNEESLGELLIAFFRYYSAFQWAETISVRTGNTEPTKMHSKVWRGPKIRIEDPTDGGNVTRAVFDEYEARRIKQSFKTASNNLNRNSSLESIL